MNELWVPQSHKRRKRTWYTLPNPSMPHPNGLLSVEALESDDGLRIILTHEKYGDDPREWVHISVSREDRLPSWDDLMVVKDEFIGEEAEAYQVLPRHSEYVNVHPNVLHVFHCVDGDLMPH